MRDPHGVTGALLLPVLPFFLAFLSLGAPAVGQEIFVDGFETGDLSLWSSFAPIDQTPPTLEIVSPNGTFLDLLTPPVDLNWGDHQSGVDPSSFSVSIDDVDLTSTCVLTQTGATCFPPPLSAGDHEIQVMLADHFGNPVEVMDDFGIELTGGLRTVWLRLEEDTYLDLSAPNTPRGGASELHAGADNRPLLRFDLTTLPELVGADEVLEANLALAVTGNGGGWVDGDTLDLHRLNVPFVEATATWNCPDDAEPANTETDCPTPWDGGDFDPIAASTFLIEDSATEGTLFDVTAEVNALMADPQANHGWMIQPSAGAGGSVRWASLEATAGHPRLRLVIGDPNADMDPPTIVVVSPEELVIDDTSPRVEIQYTDASGIDLDNVFVLIDSLPLLDCEIDPAGVTCDNFFLEEGLHFLEVVVSDNVLNRASVLWPFDVSLDQEEPELNLLAPTLTTLINAPPPTFELVYSDAESGIDLDSLLVTLDGIDVTSSCTAEATASSCLAPVLVEGDHELNVVLRDQAGNGVSLDFEFLLILDTDPPLLDITFPTDGEVLEDTSPPIRFAYGDLGAGLDLTSLVVTVDGVDQTATCQIGFSTASCDVPDLALGDHTVEVAVRDEAGLLTERGVSFRTQVADTLAPTLTLETPLALVAGDATPEIRVRFSDTDSGEGVSGIDTSGIDTSGIDEGSFRLWLDSVELTADCQVDEAGAVCEPSALEATEHHIQAELADVRGNRAFLRFDFALELELPVALDAPLQATLTTEDTIEVSGSTSTVADQVSVNGTPAVLAGDGSFVAQVPLNEGTNTLTAVAVAAGGGTGSASVSVLRDTAAPGVVISQPVDGFESASPQVMVAGEIRDPTASVRSAAATVVVNELPAAVEQRAFAVADFLLQPGENIIRAEATDQAGNVGAHEIRVFYRPDAEQRLEEMRGNNQRGMVGTRLPKPLQVRLVDYLDRPLVGRTVVFDVSRGDGTILDPPVSARRLEVVTDRNGFAQVLFQLGVRSGSGNHEVTVLSPGAPGQIVFCSTADPGPAARVVRIVGNNQLGAQAAVAGSVAPFPLFAQAFDALGNPVPGLEVVYQVAAGAGSFPDSGGDPERLTLITDNEGKTAARFRLGKEPAINANRVTVDLSSQGGLAQPGAEYLITGLVSGPEAETALSGLVLDNQDQPVPGVTLSVSTPEGPLHTVADASGRFILPGVPVGSIHLDVDGTTAARPGTWPSLEFALTAIAGQNNTIGKPIRLLPIDVEGSAIVGGDEDVTLLLDGVPGAELTIFANSVTFPDGSTEGPVFFTQVHADKVPMEAPMGSNFTLAWTVQPSGTRFDPPARIAIPNTELLPGAIADFFSFEHDIGEFVPIGTASVTEDGTQLISNPGFGIDKAGWGGAPPPPPPDGNSCHSSACQICIADRLQPKCDLKCENCNGGTCEPKTVDAATAKAAGQDERASVAMEQVVNFSVDVVGTCSERSYAWDFGDGATASGETPSHDYLTPGEYTAIVTVTCMDCAAAGSVTDTVTVSAVEFDFEIDSVPEPLSDGAEKALAQEEVGPLCQCA